MGDIGGEDERSKRGMTISRNRRRNHSQRPRLWHTITADGVDWGRAQHADAPPTPSGANAEKEGRRDIDFRSILLNLTRYK